MRKKSIGQSTVEYTVIFGVIVAALVAMQTFVKRGMQARYHDGVNYLSTNSPELGTSTQYEPYYLRSNYDTARDKSESESLGANGQRGKALNNETTTRSSGGYETYNNNPAD